MVSPAKLAILGGYPPPFGGQSVHAQRLCRLLEKRGIDYVVYNGASDSHDGARVISTYRARRRWIMRYCFTAREPVIYIMSERLAAWIVGALLASVRKKRVLVRLKSSILAEWLDASRWRAFIAKWALCRVSGIVCVHPYLLDVVRSIGIADETLLCAPGFLPPDPNTPDEDRVAPEVFAFARAHSPVISANGKVWYWKGEDGYGLDHLVELARRLTPDYPNLGIVVCFWEHRPQEHADLAQLRRRAARFGVADNILFHTKPGVFHPVIAASDLFVRPTNTDGDANSIREALYLGVPAVASDAVERPAGTIVFKTRDIVDFESKVRQTLRQTASSNKSAPPGLSPSDRARIERYIDFLIGGREN